jgi:hypothetical protein
MVRHRDPVHRPVPRLAAAWSACAKTTSAASRTYGKIVTAGMRPMKQRNGCYGRLPYRATRPPTPAARSIGYCAGCERPGEGIAMAKPPPQKEHPASWEEAGRHGDAQRVHGRRPCQANRDPVSTFPAAWAAKVESSEVATAAVAAHIKCLARSNKSCTEGKATNRSDAPLLILASCCSNSIQGREFVPCFLAPLLN